MLGALGPPNFKFWPMRCACVNLKHPSIFNKPNLARCVHTYVQQEDFSPRQHPAAPGKRGSGKHAGWGTGAGGRHGYFAKQRAQLWLWSCINQPVRVVPSGCIPGHLAPSPQFICDLIDLKSRGASMRHLEGLVPQREPQHQNRAYRQAGMLSASRRRRNAECLIR